MPSDPTSNHIEASTGKALNSALLEHTSMVLTALDITYFIVLSLTSPNPFLSVFFAALFPAMNLPMLTLSNKTGKPYIGFSLTLTLIPMYLVTYYSGPQAPGWILCFSAVAATQLMINKPLYRVLLMSAMIITACIGSFLAGRALVDVVTIFVTLLSFTVILNRVLHFMLLQNKALSRANRVAHQASQAKTRFLSNMNHELRTPMNGVLGTVQLLEETKISDEQKHYIEILKTSGEHLLTIINDILDISKLEAGKLAIDKSVFSLSDTITMVVDLFEAPLAKQFNRLNVHLDSTIPQTIVTDPIRLKQILINLIGNANKFTQNGEITIDVSLQKHQQNQFELLFKIEDNGVGIAKNKQDLIFAAFSQADASTTREYGGTGLGLAISKQLVKAMGGSIWLKSIPGEGSTFFFTLGVSEAQVMAAPEKAQVVELAPLAQRFPMNILVAEDNPINQSVIMQIMENFGYKADLAVDGLEVLKSLEEKSYDLILMDIQMPEMDGLTACKKIKLNNNVQDKPLVVAMTANTSPEDIEDCLSAGMIGHIAKPIEVDKLANIIANLDQLVSQLAAENRS